MILKRLKQYFLKKNIADALKHNRNQHQFTSCKTIGVLINKGEFANADAFISLVDTLQILNKDLKIITYISEEKSLPAFQQNYFAPNDISWNAVIRKPEIVEFVNRSYDVFIGYYSVKNRCLDLIASQVSASIKIGMHGVDERIFDLVFKIKPQEYPIFEKELKKYVTVLHKQQS